MGVVVIIVSSLGVITEWAVREIGVKIGMNVITKKVNDWENKQLQLKFKIIDETRITVDGLTDKVPQMLIGLHLDSKIPMKLCPDEIIGKLEAKGYKADFRWQRSAKTISDHIIEDIVAYGDRWWGFHIPLPYASMKANTLSTWTVHFTVIFQHQLSKTFNDVKFKLRNSDIKDIQTLPEES